MQIQYDPSVDVLVIRLRDGKVSESDEVAPGMIVDFDESGIPLAIEILNAERVLSPDHKLELPFQMSVG
ncbi:MAG: DUF2283 domain-containing protein [Anaerolineae bacterium]|nr:DUF2283 domain-containing protein [Anaerolineae bacterium]